MNKHIRQIDPDIDLLALHAQNPQRYPYLLESAASGTDQGRYDILFALPQKSMWLAADQTLHGAPDGSRDFLDALDRLWQAERQDEHSGELPFNTGWFLYLGYELAGQVEPTLNLHSPGDWPIAFATRIPAAIVRDHVAASLAIVADEAELITQIQVDIKGLPVDTARTQPTTVASRVKEEPASRFINAVLQAKRHIYAGDVFQANISREWRATLHQPVDDAHLYRRLRQRNPGPFAGLLRWKNNAVISSSPERLLRIRHRRIDTRPIAGTRPRGTSSTQDARMTQELIAHPKERAEHIMLIDLERNDLGRVCVAGTIEVDELMTLESYAHVHHIVSNVTGLLREEVTPAEAIRAVFPGGTITGCPKVRCMEIINDLEDKARGPYTGSMGYLDRSGHCDLNILIRTLVRSGRRISLRAGAGIVADSVPESEVEETRAKARGLLLALGAEVP